MARKTPTLATLKRHFKILAEGDRAKQYAETTKHKPPKCKRAIAAGEKSEKALIKYGLLDKDGNTKFGLKNKVLATAAEWFANKM